MRFVVYGAGAIGGVVGGRLHQQGHDVVLIARGRHYQALRDRGLRLESPDAVVTLRMPVASGPSQVAWEADDVVLLAVKSQDTARALDELATAAPPSTPVASLQNGVENERLALRLFARVYGVCVMCPATHLEPGVVQAYSTPTTGVLDVGRYPAGLDDVAEALAAAFSGATFTAEARPDIMRWKYAKLLLNLGNAVEAVCGPAARGSWIDDAARAEGEACLRADGIDFVSAEDDAARRGDLIRLRPIGGQRREGGSSWQSLTRASGTIETDYLNGEIVLLGRLHYVPTPVNELLRRLAGELARGGRPPGQVSLQDFERLLPASAHRS